MTEGTRRYVSTLRAARADETRARIAAAARDSFVTRGWTATTMRAVADGAGVSIPTVYAAYGNKRALAVALMDAADLDADPSRLAADLMSAHGVPKRVLAASVAFDCRLYERSGELLVLLREAGRGDPDLAAASAEGRRRGDAARAEVFAAWEGVVLRAGLTAERAVDEYAAICAVDAFGELTTVRGWTSAEVEDWWTRVVVRELLPDEHSVGGSRDEGLDAVEQ